MNEVRIDGKALNAYLNDEGHFVCVVATVHDHFVNGYNNVSESVIRCFLPDRLKSKEIDVIKGDRVSIVGYLRQDHFLNSRGKEKKRVNVYIKDITISN